MAGAGHDVIEESVKSDPVAQKYGVGVTNYFNLQKSLIRIFCWLSVLATIQIIIFANFKGLNYVGAELSGYVEISFGNIGFSKSTCGMTLINWKDPKDYM